MAELAVGRSTNKEFSLKNRRGTFDVAVFHGGDVANRYLYIYKRNDQLGG